MAVLAVLALSFMGAISNVSNELTEEDRFYIREMLDEAGHASILPGIAASASFDQQIGIIRALQDTAFSASPENQPIGLFHTREPKDVYLARRALCFDRSRLIEKLAAYAGFPVEHISIYRRSNWWPGIIVLFTPRVESHAMSGVRTDRGWIVVDSTSRWIALAQDGRPLSISQIARLPPTRRHWSQSVEELPNKLLRGPFIYVIGLYSRHGFFYPPYVPFPDVSFSQLKANWIEGF
jgi:hypothetical protein